jgi:hypothetical protein
LQQIYSSTARDDVLWRAGPASNENSKLETVVQAAFLNRQPEPVVLPVLQVDVLGPRSHRARGAGQRQAEKNKKHKSIQQLESRVREALAALTDCSSGMAPQMRRRRG